MFFIGIITDKNSENNIKSIMKSNIKDNNEIVFLNKENMANYRNVKFDSIVLNDVVDGEDSNLEKILEKSKYTLLNSDIHCKNDEIIKYGANIITYGYNSKASVTISSATEDDYMIFIQDNICNANDLQEIKFERSRNNINAYDGMILTIMDLIYDKNKK